MIKHKDLEKVNHKDYNCCYIATGTDFIDELPFINPEMVKEHFRKYGLLEKRKTFFIWETDKGIIFEW